jgi:hypothetical protein
LFRSPATQIQHHLQRANSRDHANQHQRRQPTAYDGQQEHKKRGTHARPHLAPKAALASGSGCGTMDNCQ